MSTSLQATGSPSLSPSFDIEINNLVEQTLARVSTVARVKKALMKPEVHYGVPPGMEKKEGKPAPKPVLLKPGAELLLMAFQMKPRYIKEEFRTPDAIRISITAEIFDKHGNYCGMGVGECSTDETKYKWRRVYEQSEYDSTPEDRRKTKTRTWKDKSSGGKEKVYTDWLVRTEPADNANTVLKMATKRALVHAAITITAASDMFDQDLDEVDAAYAQYAPEDEDQDEVRVEPSKKDTKPAQKPSEASGGTQAKAEPQKSQEGAKAGDGGPDNNDLAKLHMLLPKAFPDITDQAERKSMLLALLHEEFGVSVTSTKELDRETYAKLMARLAEMATERAKK